MKLTTATHHTPYLFDILNEQALTWGKIQTSRPPLFISRVWITSCVPQTSLLIVKLLPHLLHGVAGEAGHGYVAAVPLLQLHTLVFVNNCALSIDCSIRYSCEPNYRCTHCTYCAQCTCCTQWRIYSKYTVNNVICIVNYFHSVHY